MKNLRHLFRRSGKLAFGERRRRPEHSRRSNVTQRRLSNEILEKRELLAGDLAPEHNYWNRYDVNDDGNISGRDALGIINYMSRQGEAEQVDADAPKMYYDVNADGNVSASDALGVINAMSRGEEVGELVELLITARDHVTDQELPRDSSNEYNVAVGEIFDIEISYDDLRLFNDRLGVFQLFTDITISQPGVLSPVLNETQRLIIDETLTQQPFPTSLTFTIDEAPDVPGVTPTELFYESSFNNFANNSTVEVANALRTFGYTDSQFELTTLDFGNNDLGFQIHWVGDEFGNVDLPNISVEVNENGGANVPTQTVEFAPFVDDGSGNLIPNTDAVRFNVNTFSRTFNDNERFYSAQNRGELEPRDASGNLTGPLTGFSGVGGLGMVPLEGGGIPQLTDDGGFIEPFDAFSLTVFFNTAVDAAVISVNPGDDPEATLLYGRDEAVPPDMVLIETTDTNSNGIANFTINAIADVSPGTISIAPVDPVVDEDAGTVALQVRREGGSDGAVSVFFNTADGTAVAGSDYTATNGRIDFSDGDSATKTINVPILDDTVVETPATETFTVTLTDVTGGAGLGNDVATVTINDDDVPDPTVSVRINPSNVNEDGSEGGLIYTFTRTGDNSGPLDVGYAIDLASTATANVDYVAPSGMVTIETNQSTATVTINPIDDNEFEGNETIILTVADGANYDVGSPNSATGTIRDDDVEGDPLVSVSLDSPTSVFEDTADTLVYTFTRSGDASQELIVSYTVSGDVTPGTDFPEPSTASGTVTIPAQQFTATVTISPTDDTEVEGDELVILTVNDGTNYNVGSSSSATGTILDDDEPGVITIDPTSVNVDEGGTVSLMIRRTGGSAGAVSVSYSTANIDAIAGSDYDAVSDSVSFADGDSAPKTITIGTINDTLDEDNEMFSVNLTGATGAPIGSADSATVTIIDNDDTVPGVFVITPQDPSFSESAGTVTFTVTRTGGTDGAVSVSYATSNGNAIAPSDYVATSGTLNFGDGEATKTFTVTINDDSLDEPDETFIVSLINPTGGASLGSDSSTVVTILDNDLPGPGQATISGFVFIDEINNIQDYIFGGADPIRDGIKSSNEIGIGGVQINLSDGTGVSHVAFTDIDGRYDFEGLLGGTYEVMIDADDSLILAGASELIVTLNSNSASASNVNFPLINTAGPGTDTVDILASTYMRNDDGDGREGGLAALDPSGDQEFFVIFGGYEGVSFLEITLNAERDAALLTILEDDGELLSARLTAGEDFVVNDSGTSVQFFGGRDDHDFFDIDAGSAAEFDDFLDALNRYRGS